VCPNRQQTKAAQSGFLATATVPGLVFLFSSGRDLLYEPISVSRQDRKLISQQPSSAAYKIRRVGPQPGSVVAVGRYADWAMFAKVRSDAEFEQFLEKMRNNPDPPADVVSSAVL
jgi:hypothetical protein